MSDADPDYCSLKLLAVRVVAADNDKGERSLSDAGSLCSSLKPRRVCGGDESDGVRWPSDACCSLKPTKVCAEDTGCGGGWASDADPACWLKKSRIALVVGDVY